MAAPRYHVETRAGAAWGWYAGSDDRAEADAQLRAAKRTGYAARLRDTRAGLDEPELTAEELAAAERELAAAGH